jgi:hypothetical protein
MAYTSCKDILDNFIDAIRTYANTSTGALKDATVRKGPIFTLKLGAAHKSAVIVSLQTLEGGEQAAGSGNHWWHDWVLKVDLLVPDANGRELTVTGQEGLRCDLLDDFMEFIHETRCLVPGVKTGRVSGAEFGIAALSEEDQQVFRSVELRVNYKALV